MKEMRLIGNMVRKLAKESNCSDTDICNTIDCTLNQYYEFLDGRLFLSFEQLEKLAQFFKVTVDEIMTGDSDYYEKNVVHCMGEFENTDNREMILDIIDDYLTLLSVQK